MSGRIEISRSALAANLGLFRELAPAAEIVAVVKANAYGHGMTEVVGCIESLTDRFAVEDFDELMAIRQLTQKPVMVLGYLSEAEMAEAIKSDTTLTIMSLGALKQLNTVSSKAGKVTKFNLMLDSRFGREGFLGEEIRVVAQELAVLKHVQLEALQSHYSDIDDKQHSNRQDQIFELAFRQLANAYPKVKRHIAATGGAMIRPSGNNFIRVGLGLYGMSPNGAYQDKLRPVMRWVSQVAQVKLLPAEFPVGYGQTFRTQKPTRLAVIPQGYSDGYDRGLSNCGEVLINGRRCPLIGNVSMNLMTVDVSSVAGVSVGDEVVLLGNQERERITAEELAEKISTINYEITARVGPLLERTVVN